MFPFSSLIYIKLWPASRQLKSNLYHSQ